MASLTGTFRTVVAAKLTKILGISTPVEQINEDASWTIADGSIDQQANQSFGDKRTLADGVLEDIDLAGSLVNGLDETITFSLIKAVYIEIVSGIAILEVGGAAANPWEGWISAAGKVFVKGEGVTGTTPAKGQLAIVDPGLAGYPVTAGTADLLRIKHDGSDTADLVYKIVIIGVE